MGAGDTVQAVPRAGYVSFMYSYALTTACGAPNRSVLHQGTQLQGLHDVTRASCLRSMCIKCTVMALCVPCASVFGTAQPVGQRCIAEVASRYPNLLPLPAAEVERMQKAVEGWGLDFERLYGGESPHVPVQSWQLSARRAFSAAGSFQSKDSKCKQLYVKSGAGQAGTGIAVGMQLHVE